MVPQPVGPGVKYGLSTFTERSARRFEKGIPTAHFMQATVFWQSNLGRRWHARLHVLCLYLIDQRAYAMGDMNGELTAVTQELAWVS